MSKMAAIRLLVLTLLVAIAFPNSARAEDPTSAKPTAAQVRSACVDGRVETLPNPYSDVARHHWAFEAVMMIYYCGPIRESTPEWMLERSRQRESSPEKTNPSLQ
jgi:hypothetical protein